MTKPLSRRGSDRRTRLWVALAAALAVVASPLLAVIPAQADPSGYVGAAGEAAGYWDADGNRTLPLMTEGTAYSGSLTGPQFGVGQTYKWTVTSGALPTGITLASPAPSVYAASATFSGTPTTAEHFAFTLLADTGEGGFELSFEGDVAPAATGVPPTWTDQTLPAFQVSVPVADGVAADGDETITYTVSTGALPAGLALSATTGAITGTPTSAGPYAFDLTATNDAGHVTASFAGTVAAAPVADPAPVIDLTLTFDAGTPLADASSTISADGLKVGSEYTLTMYSTPVILYTGVIGPTGGFTWTVSLPANTPVGAHQLILTGIAPNGSTMSAMAWFTLLPNGTIGAISYSGPFSLAETGAEVVAPIVLASALLVVGVTAFILDRRRRRA